MRSDFSAVLLAGGKSTRMGRDKAAVLVEGRELWARQLDTLRRTGAGELFISGFSDGPYAAAGLSIIADENVGFGPLGGIVAALRADAHHPARSKRKPGSALPQWQCRRSDSDC